MAFLAYVRHLPKSTDAVRAPGEDICFPACEGRSANTLPSAPLDVPAAGALVTEPRLGTSQSLPLAGFGVEQPHPHARVHNRRLLGTHDSAPLSGLPRRNAARANGETIPRHPSLNGRQHPP